MQRWLLVPAAVAALLFLPLTAAQSLDPVREKAERDAAELQQSPVGFVQSRASPQGVEREANWTRDYACETVGDTAQTGGLPRPDLPVCPKNPSISGAQPEPEEPVGEVQELEDGADRVVDEAVGTVEEIVGNPAGAVDALVDFLGFMVEFVRGLLEDILAIALAPVSIAVHSLVLVAQAFGFLFSSASSAVNVAAGLGADLAGAPASAIAAVADGASDGSDAVGHTVEDALAQVGQTIHDSLDAVGQWIGDLVGHDSGAQAPSDAPSLPIDGPEVSTDAVGDLLAKAKSVAG